VWIGLGLRCGANPIVWSYVGGLAAFAVTLHATWRLATALCGRSVAALAVMLLLATNASTLYFATGGLETMLQAAWTSQAALQLLRLRSAVARRRASANLSAATRDEMRHALALGAFCGGALLTRLDSALPVAVLGASALLALLPPGPSAVAVRRESRRVLLALALPVLLLMVPWLAWKLAYYGSVLPNTYAAKVAWSGAMAAAGLLYLWRFVNAYLLWPFLAVAAIGSIVHRVRGNAPPPPVAGPLARSGELPPGVIPAMWKTLGLVLLVWYAYLVVIGGDFMEFRLCVPVMPFLFLVLTGGLAAAPPRRLVLPSLAVLVLVLGLSSLLHARRFRGVTPDYRLDSVPTLATFYDVYPDRDFSTIGSELGRQLAGTDAQIALHAVGAIPYYSGLRTVDMFGLNDRQIARTGHRAPPRFRRPGHQRQVTLADLRQRGVHLIIGHPTLVPPGAFADPRISVYGQWVRDILGYSREPLGRVQLVGMPLPRGDLLMWYLTPSPAIDAVIREHGWGTATIQVRR